MAEKVENPLRDIYRQLGIPLSGEGEFADVKPNTVVRPWSNFESIHEMMDSDYAKAKRLGTVQQSMLQDFIHGAQAFKALQSTQVPTVGDAQTLFPEHKELIPAQAWGKVPQAPLSSEELPVLQGTQRQTVPDNRFQGPMPGVMSPLAQFYDNQRKLYGDSALSEDQLRTMNERQGDGYYRGEPLAGLFTEGPRPMRTIETGVYGADTAPAETLELNTSMKLPPAFQAQLGALQHQLSTRQPAAHSLTEAEVMLANQQRLERIMATNQEAYPGERRFLESRLSVYNKESRPNSTAALTDEAKLAQEQAKANVAPQKEAADLAHTKQSTSKLEADEQEVRLLMDAKLKKLQAEANAANAVGSRESLKAYAQEQLALLNRGKVVIDMAIEGRKGGKMDDKSYSTLMDLGLALMNVGVSAQQTERNWFEEHFGTKAPVEIAPRSSTEPPRTLRPQGTGIPELPQLAPMPQAPVAPQANPAQEEADLKAFGRTLKEGETKTYKGTKWTRKGGKLIEVR